MRFCLLDRIVELEPGVRVTATKRLRPDEDLIRDLQSEGFQNPLLFRTCAQRWADGTREGSNGSARPAG